MTTLVSYTLTAPVIPTITPVYPSCCVDCPSLYNVVNKTNSGPLFLFVCLFYYSLNVTGNHVPIIRRSNYIKATLLFVTLCRLLPGMQVGFKTNLHTRRSSTQIDRY